MCLLRTCTTVGLPLPADHGFPHRRPRGRIRQSLPLIIHDGRRAAPFALTGARQGDQMNARLGITVFIAAGVLGPLTVFAPSPASGQPATAPNFAPASIKEELLYQRATQSYLWALPLLNMRAMK